MGKSTDLENFEDLLRDIGIAYKRDTLNDFKYPGTEGVVVIALKVGVNDSGVGPEFANELFGTYNPCLDIIFTEDGEFVRFDTLGE